MACHALIRCPWGLGAHEAEHLLLFLMTICVSSWEKRGSKSFAHGHIGYLSFRDQVVRVLYIFESKPRYQINDLQFFSPILWAVFVLSQWCVACTLSTAGPGRALRASGQRASRDQCPDNQGGFKPVNL